MRTPLNSRRRDTSPIDASIADLLAESKASLHTNPRIALRVARTALKRARSHRLYERQALALITCADAARLLNRFDRVAEYFAELVGIVDVLPDTIDKSMTLHALGKHIFEQDHHNNAEALAYLCRSLEIAMAVGNRVSTSFILHTIGSVYSTLCIWNRGLEYYFESLRLREEIGDPTFITMSLINIGNVYGAIGDYERASDYYRRSWELMKDDDGVRFNPTRATTLNNLGCALLRMDRPDEALTFLEPALALYEAKDDRLYILETLTNIGHAHEKLGNVETAILYQERALTSINEHTYRPLRVRVKQNAARTYGRTGRVDEALTLYAQALALAEESDLPADKVAIYAELGELHAQLGEYRAAYEYRQKELETKNYLMSLERQREVVAAEQIQRMAEVEKERARLRERAERAELEAESRARELNGAALDLTQRESSLKGIADALRSGAREQHGDVQEFAESMLARIGEALKKTDASRTIHERFEQIHQSFIASLIRRAPDLTPTEIRVCCFVRLGLSSKEIADLCFTSVLTVKTHRTRARKKLGLENGANLVRYLLEVGT